MVIINCDEYDMFDTDEVMKRKGVVRGQGSGVRAVVLVTILTTLALLCIYPNTTQPSELFTY